MMYEIKAVIRPDMLDDVVQALHRIPDMPGVTVSVVRGYGKRSPPAQAGVPEYGETEMTKLETVVPESLRDRVVSTVGQAARTGRPGDGKIFVSRVDDAVTIRSGAHGSEAL